MDTQRAAFALNREEGKMLGVCAGIADHFGIDVLLVRIGMAISAVMTFPIVPFGYLAVAMVAGRKAPSVKSRREKRVRSRREETVRDHRETAGRPHQDVGQRMRDLDARLAAIEEQVTSSGARLAQEIDELR